MKICKQCGEALQDDQFRKYVSRSTGKYKTKQGSHTICLGCEAISRRCTAAMSKNDQEAICSLRNYFQELGRPLVTAPARRLMEGVEIVSPVDLHYSLVKDRKYPSIEEAQQRHKELRHLMKDRYEEITELLDEWYFS